MKNKSCLYEKTIDEENYCKLTWMPCNEFEECPEDQEEDEDVPRTV